MDRVAIVGCSGGGKSTLARGLGERLRAPVVHLDSLFWEPGWTEGDPARFRAAVDAALGGDRWVCDGNFTSVADISLGRADTIVWLERPVGLCLRRAVWRAVSQFGRTRADLAPGCPERIDFAFYRYILDWNQSSRPRLTDAVETFGARTPLIRLGSDRQISAWLDGVS
jgi:adenylate kinase family enzyme